MPGKRKRANGPYEHGAKFRIVLSPPPSDGSSRYRVFDTRREAELYRDEFNLQTQTVTVGQAVREYLDHLARFGGPRKNEPLRKSSLDSVRHRLMGILALDQGDRPLASVTPREAQRLYDRRVATKSVDTHRGELVFVQVFFKWFCVGIKEWVSADPFAAVRPEGERTRGKDQLDIDNARRYLETCLEENSAESIAAAALLVLGVRVSELVDRTVADLNLNPVVLSIRASKTKAGARKLKVPDPIAAPLVRLCAGKAPGERIFPFTRYALYHHVKRLCTAAGVPEVCPHGLRGSATTNELTAGGKTLEEIARDRGWANVQVGRDHYLAPGTEETIAAEARARLLTPGNKLETPPQTEFPSQQKEEPNWN